MNTVFIIHLKKHERDSRERYFTLVGRLWGWTRDRSNALQFARERDALAVATAFCPTPFRVIPRELPGECDPLEVWPTPSADEFQEFEYDG